MKKKIIKSLFILFLVIMSIVIGFNIYKAIVTGNQTLQINTSSKVYTNSDMYVSIIAKNNGEELETKSTIKLLNSKGKKVKNAKVNYNEKNAIISIPNIEPGEYIVEAKVSSKKGKDKIEKKIYILNGEQENATITFDKGIYKPGDTVKFRALLTTKENDTPIEEDVNISIYDGNNNKVYNEDKKTSDYGIISDSFMLANEVNSGTYKLVVKTNSSETIKQFKVNPYLLPKYEVKIDFDKNDYLVNDNVIINLNSKYFFGEPVSNVKYKVYINNKEFKTVNGDENGNAKLEHKAEKAMKYNVKVEAVDSSNYYVEASNQFSVKTDIFEIELLPEHGHLIAGRKNNIYVFTKDINGKPIKSYVTVSSNKYTKQIATDDNGIGSFSIDIENYKNNNYNSNQIEYNYNNKYSNIKSFKISAVNMKNEKVEKNINLKIENKNLLISTDKAKYNQNEDIKLKIDSLNEKTKNIYFFKNDKLIKMITTDDVETNVNLDNTYGLIDIYVTEGKINTANHYSESNTDLISKRTIFIKPDKKINIDIKTDKEEYKPGENITISFGTTNEENSPINTALLVSMIDNSVLNLQDNDLSIDNIKLALSDIKFSNELDAATLYSSIVNDESEQTITALLLKQKENNLNISEVEFYNSAEKEKAQIIAIILSVVLAIIIISYLCIKFPKFRKVIKHVLNALITIGILEAFNLSIINEFFYSMDGLGWIYVVTAILALIIYILWLSRLEDKISRTSISLIISYITMILITIVIGLLENIGVITLMILAIVALILAILIKINEHRKLKMNKFIVKISNEITYIAKFIFSVWVALIIGKLVQIISIEGIMIPIAIVGIYILNKIFNKLGRNKQANPKKENILKYMLSILVIIGVLSILVFIIYMKPKKAMSSHTTRPTYPMLDIDSVIGDAESSAEGTETNSIISNNGIISSIIDGMNSFGKKEENTTETNNDNSIKEEKVIDNKIRNVFLESMCFVPDLIANNGNAELKLDLADNITTWTIQTVGNTKDGKIGYNRIDNVKVFKEFFADFELPNNLKVEDKVSIPVTVYNYTKEQITATLKIKEEDWFSSENNNLNIKVEPEKTSMVYIPIKILKFGNYKFNIEVSSNGLTDIIEKTLKISPKGRKIEKVISTGRLDENINEDILFLEDMVENTASAKIKIYPNNISQTLEGMESIFRMPTGCFEQVSSSLYPNILALKYLEDSGIVNDKIKEKALNYISTGYQKLLSFEVRGESGGYSLYGRAPAETVLTAYGLMELTDLRDVYNVDENVINKMNEFLYKKQKANGSFKITGNSAHYVVGSKEDLSLNAYVIWALSESNPEDSRLKKSVEYLKEKIDKVNDNYTLALIANVLENVKDKEANNVVKKLINNVTINQSEAYITSNIKDYYGSYGKTQNIQTTALTSSALSKSGNNGKLNKLLINYLIKNKDRNGTWYSTQATILSLRAINEANKNNKLENQVIKVRVNDDEKKIKIDKNSLEVYELEFNNLLKENKINIEAEKGNAYYEIIEEYYVPYEKINTKDNKLEIMVNTNNDLKVNEKLESNIQIINRSKETIYNGMVTITIPQGFTVDETSLSKLKERKIIEKYEMNYNTINIYLRNFSKGQIKKLEIDFRALYPVDILGLSVRAYDYYNPEIKAESMPINLIVK